MYFDLVFIHPLILASKKTSEDYVNMPFAY